MAVLTLARVPVGAFLSRGQACVVGSVVTSLANNGSTVRRWLSTEAKSSSGAFVGSRFKLNNPFLKHKGIIVCN